MSNPNILLSQMHVWPSIFVPHDSCCESYNSIDCFHCAYFEVIEGITDLYDTFDHFLDLYMEAYRNVQQYGPLSTLVYLGNTDPTTLPTEALQKRYLDAVEMVEEFEE